MATQSQVDGLPNPFSKDDMDRIEEALRQLAPVKDLIARCERCKIPVTGVKSDCEDLCSFFQSLIAEFRGPQGGIPTR